MPVKIYIFDVTDTIKISDDSGGMIPEHDCQVSDFIKKYVDCLKFNLIAIHNTSPLLC